MRHYKHKILVRIYNKMNVEFPAGNKITFQMAKFAGIWVIVISLILAKRVPNVPLPLPPRVPIIGVGGGGVSFQYTA